MSDTNLSGKVALVTGGSRGIGAAIAAALSAAGASVVITGRDETQLAAVQSRIGGASERIHTVRADVREPEDVERAVMAAQQAFGGLDILVNNAGVGLFGSIGEMSVSEWRQVIDTNLTGVFLFCNTAIPYLKRRGGGWIINISSLASQNPFTGGGAYCASKAALNAFSHVLMQEVRYDNIRVSSVMPGSVSTGFSGRGDKGKADWKLAPEDVAQVVLDLVSHPARSLPSSVELRPSKPARPT